MLEAAVVAVEGKIDAGINALVSNAAVLRDVGMPL
jgi:hypothetical protein